jgi:hypothetical protein
MKETSINLINNNKSDNKLLLVKTFLFFFN